MAESDSESESQSDTLSLRHISSSLFNIPGFFVGFGSKGSSDSDSIRSPTSPLDLGVFSNFRKPVSLRFARSSSENGHKKEWQYSKVGLGIVNSLVNDTTGGGLDIPKQKNIIFGPQVKTNTTNSLQRYRGSLDSSLKSKSLPTNYIASRLSQTKCPNPHLGSKNVVFDSEVPLETEMFENTQLCFSDSSSLVSLNYNHNLRSEDLCPEAQTRMGSPSVIGTSSEVENSLVKPSTLPIPIDSSQGYVGSLSAKEIELSEDYTCIISHGPNPKTIHIFGDYVLECHKNESNNFGSREELGIESRQAANNSEGLTSVHSAEVLKFCYSCKRILENDGDIYMYRGEKAFCSFDCRSEEISEEETEGSYQNSAGNSPGSSFHEDLFVLGMPVAM
ncbi:Zf-FLZ domain containing protein [Parasponia andersonii]|uniref:Zf-FLZ domain containing protein n=1 Tax=Parasponia andersonii TaxID=3476 RepID=A0A2P5AHK8_PARAD|nr:Zf-FLZ domain containing protein [Parasponia andersonii]